MTYTRQNPSPRYTELLEQYKQMHEEGDIVGAVQAGNTFAGMSLGPHIAAIKNVVEGFGAKSLLDYGCGKAKGYEPFTVDTPEGPFSNSLSNIWGLTDFGFYDPGHAPFTTLPERTFDAVISTDVLEHCPEEDLPWIVSEIFGYSEKFVYCTVALYPAVKTLPNGQNAHISLKSIGWWVDLFEHTAKNFGGHKYFLVGMRGRENMMFIES